MPEKNNDQAGPIEITPNVYPGDLPTMHPTRLALGARLYSLRKQGQNLGDYQSHDGGVSSETEYKNPKSDTEE